MKICFVSDLHIDIGSQPKIEWPEADILVITGDTANSLGGVQKLFKSIAGRYQHVLYVSGNHEHYSNSPQNRTVAETEAKLAAIVAEAGGIYLPTVDHVQIGDLYFVGRNGWYSMDYDGRLNINEVKWRENMNDNRWIGFDKIHQPMPWELAKTHAADFDRIMGDIIARDPSARIVAMTHTAPTLETLSSLPEHACMNDFYVNMNMQTVIDNHSTNIMVWAHGHTHYRQDKRVQGIEFIVNPRGYPYENPNWEPVVIDY